MDNKVTRIPTAKEILDRVIRLENYLKINLLDLKRLRDELKTVMDNQVIINRKLSLKIVKKPDNTNT